MKKIKRIILLMIPLFFFSNNNIFAKEIEINKWQPESIAKTPNKTNYILGEIINLKGLKINFFRYIKNGGRVEKEIKIVDMDNKTIKNGWELNLDNEILFNLGKQKISFTLRLINSPMQYDVLYPEKVEIDDDFNIISKEENPTTKDILFSSNDSDMFKKENNKN